MTGFPGKPGMTAAEGHLSGRIKSRMTGFGIQTDKLLTKCT
jgi:hypothetical protein